MNSSGRGTGIVGYNLQAAVDTKYHLIAAHTFMSAICIAATVIFWLNQ